MVFRSAAVAALTVVFASAMNASARADPVDPAGTVQVGPSSPSTVGDRYDVLAGDAQYLVYSRVVQLADGGTDASTTQLVARSAAGSTVELPTAAVDPETYSIVGTTLVAAPYAPSSKSQTVYWWDVTSGDTGQASLPAGDQLESAAPDGFVYSAGDKLFEESRSGTVTSLGTPFPGDAYLSATASDEGLVVVGDASTVAYMPFSTPGTFTPLRAGTTLPLSCEVATASYAGCFGGDEDTDTHKVILIPLDGGAPTSSSDEPSDVAVSGSTLLWRGLAGLNSLTAGSSHVTTSATKLGDFDDPDLVTAYGRGVGLSPTGQHIVSVTSASAPATSVVAGVMSPVSQAAFALTGGRVAYVGDQQVRGSKHRLSAFSATLSTKGSLTAGTPSLVRTGVDLPAVAAVAASGSTTVTQRFTAHDTADLDVVSPHHTHTITGVRRGSGSVSGDRVLYSTLKKSSVTYRVYNVSTKHTSVVLHGTTDSDDPVISGHCLAYDKTDGSIWRKDLKTGKAVKLAGGRPDFDFALVYAHGNYVAWEVHPNNDSPVLDYYRNAKTGAPAVALPSESLVGLCGKGALLTNAPVTDEPSRGVGAYRLHTFAGTTIPLLRTQQLMALPQIVGSTMAWIDVHGQLKAAPVPAG